MPQSQAKCEERTIKVVDSTRGGQHKQQHTPRTKPQSPRQGPGTQKGTQQAKTQEFTPSSGECLLFFVYRSEFDQRMRNAIIRFGGRIKAYSGKPLGIATQVSVEAPEGSKWLQRKDFCICVLSFPSQQQARLWFVSEPEVKQHDFPPPSDGVQVFTVPIRYIPQSGRQTYCWTEINEIRNKGSFQSDFVDKVTPLMDEKGINHGLVYLKDKEAHQLDRLRDCWVQHKAHYRLDLYNDVEEYWELYNSAPYKPLQETRDGLSETTTVLFKLDPKIA